MKRITVDGKEYPCRVTMGAMVRFKRESGKDVSMISQSEVYDLVLFLWCCIASACAADGVEWPYPFERFADCIGPEDLNGFYEGMDKAPKKKAGR